MLHLCNTNCNRHNASIYKGLEHFVTLLHLFLMYPMK
nr:MAG TPA: hypothetical protein [Caudoviricetes sp.]